MHLLICILINYLMVLMAMAFFTLLERKVLGYIQIRKGPNKVSLMGLPQPFADAIKLFTKELSLPTSSNLYPFIYSPIMGLSLALLFWSLYPYSSPMYFPMYGALLFLCISSLNVYATLSAGWSSNSKYALLGAIRSIAQTISYEVSMALTLLSALIILLSFNLILMTSSQWSWVALMFPPLFMIWFITSLAETNRTPFDLSEGESELVSGFNVEFSAGSFALIFMAEYTNILTMSLFTSIFFFGMIPMSMFTDIPLILKTMFFAFLFIWVRGTLPRMRYDKLMNLAWKSFLPLSLSIMILSTSMMILI
uniref:NADH-ubiquinone oxidoreductase chain 1 n=1 Tax=Lamellibrachia satsuma TaxID=104711 RepID=A0A0K0Q5Y9_LAMSA|nr:NADH dehydrogenase subunit 1 [Lamellibrachia satsuma]YP_010938132.1 NADH dehydrogenase subunit 1 [Lamellibrachia barhami]AKR07097.1 NADH dehydrogenase subunit 1 [Lamellibrachia satsuma]WLD05632.1 NADH dehydrogenase subunit 1 [Lamellibrachia barhami]